MPEDESGPERLAEVIRSERERRGWTQDDLAAASGVSRPTVQRYENAKTKTPEPDQLRAIFLALNLKPLRIPVILGYVTAEELGLPPEPPRVFDRSIEDVIAILQDPDVDSVHKAQWVDYLRFLRSQAQQGDNGEGRRRVAG